MNGGSVRSIAIMLLLITTGSYAFLITVPEESTAIEPPSTYHIGVIHLNVTGYNGTPAAGYRAYWNCMHSSQSYWATLGPDGKGTLNLAFHELGEGTFRIRNATFKTVHLETFNVDPDEDVYRNITLHPPDEPINVITGILRNGSSMEPIPGVEIGLNTNNDFGEDFTLYNTTDQDGRYRFEVVNISHFCIHLYSHSTNEYPSVNRMFFMTEGVHHYDLDLYTHPHFRGDIVSRIRFIKPGGETIPGLIDLSTFATGNTYSSFDEEHDPPDGEGWVNHTTSFGETSAYFHPVPDLLPRTSMLFTYYFQQNGTPTDTEIPLDLSFLVPVEVEVWNSSGPVQGATLYFSDQGTREFGKYSLDYSNHTDEKGTLLLHVPRNGIYSMRLLKMNYNSWKFKVDTTRPGPYRINVTMEGKLPYTPPPKARINITCVDNETGIKVPYISVYGGGSYRDHYLSFSGSTGSNGVLSLVVDAIDYQSLSASFNLAHGEIEDVEVLSGEPNNFTIIMDRYETTDQTQSKPYHFYVVDEEGEPVPGAVMYVSYLPRFNYFSSSEIQADRNGRIDVIHIPGKELTLCMHFRTHNGEWNPWAMQMIKLHPGAADTRLPDVTVYPRWHPATITGFVRDSSTMKPLFFQDVNCHSVREQGVPARILMMMEDYMKGIDYMSLSRTSNIDGFYRIYGLQTAILEVHREGYFVYKERVQIESTRGDVEHDILLDPLPGTMAWLNGTLVDRDNTTVPGKLSITDIDHPGEIGHDVIINETGKFSIQLYASNYRLLFSNETLEGSMDVNLTDNGLQGVILQLIPYSVISGRTVNRTGDPVEGANVTLLKISGNNFIPMSWFVTGSDGNFSFSVIEGVYRIVINASELYERYVVDNIEVNGWNNWFSMLYLTNRTNADVSGTVTGSEGPYINGVPGVTVSIMENGTDIVSTVTDGEGHFGFEDVDHGTYTLIATPPENIGPVPGIRSGYLQNITANFTVSGAHVVFDPVLEYVIHSPPGFVNITYNAPNGTGVFLDDAITIGFSEVMNRTAVQGSITISPTVENITFSWDDWGYVLTLKHDLFSPDTLYTVTIGPGAVSEEGWALWGNEAFSWNFTTGNITNPWKIISADVELEAMNLSVSVRAPGNETIYIMVSEIGYFRLEEGTSGTYSLLLDSSHFDCSTTYRYFFTDRFNGDDMAPALSGNFTTPGAPEPEWKITNATVQVLSGGDWKVRVDAQEGIDIYIIIDGVGSFKLQEGAPGKYAVNINSTEFGEGRTYTYHFSDSENGEDKAPSFSGSATDPRQSPKGGSLLCIMPLIILISILVLISLIGIVIIVMVIANRKRASGEYGEE